MANNKSITSQSTSATGKDTRQQMDEMNREPAKNPVVKEALKKEKQPVSKDDLSALHNTQEIGTSGGDQRASKTELNQDTTNSGLPSSKKRKKS